MVQLLLYQLRAYIFKLQYFQPRDQIILVWAGRKELSRQTYMYAISKCAFLLGFHLEMPQRSNPLLVIKKLINVGVERGVATRMAQVV